MQHTTRFLAAALTTLCMAGGAQAATVVHDYQLNGTLTDALGGPALVAINAGGANGTIGATGFSFPANSGLQLTGGQFNANTYSIEMAFTFDEVSSWRRIIDFKDRATDFGLYNLSGGIQFFPHVVGSSIFLPGGQVNIVITRDDATDDFNVYAGGLNILNLADTAGDAVFSTSGQIVNFFRDDVVVPNEASAGFVDKIRFYNGALTANEVACLQTGTPAACGIPPGGTVPLPGTLALAGLGLALMSVMRRSRT